MWPRRWLPDAVQAGFSFSILMGRMVHESISFGYSLWLSCAGAGLRWLRIPAVLPVGLPACFRATNAGEAGLSGAVARNFLPVVGVFTGVCPGVWGLTPAVPAISSGNLPAAFARGDVFRAGQGPRGGVQTNVLTRLYLP